MTKYSDSDLVPYNPYSVEINTMGDPCILTIENQRTLRIAEDKPSKCFQVNIRDEEKCVNN